MLGGAVLDPDSAILSDGPIGGNSALPSPWWLLLALSIPILIERESDKSDRDQGGSRDDQPVRILQG